MVDSSNTNVINDFVSSGKYLFVAGGRYVERTGILRRSSDDGTTWETITNGISNSPITQITGSGEQFYLLSTNPQAIGSGFVFHSNDGGLSWSKVAIGISSYSTVELLFDGTNLLALINNNQFYTSTDNGNTWVLKSKITSNASLQGLIKEGTLFYTFSAALIGYYYSDDNCTTWKLSSTPNVFIQNISTDGKNLYMVANDNTQSTYLSIDEGKTFTKGTRISGVYVISNIAGIGDAVFIGGRLTTNYLYVSTDKMQTWKNITDGIPLTDYVLNKILIKGDYVYLGFNFLSVSKPGYQIWRRKLSDFGILTGIAKQKEIPSSFMLHQNYPNPFNPSTTISFSIPQAMVRQAHHDNTDVIPSLSRDEVHVTLKVYDVLGREVATLVNDNLSAGSYSYNFDASKLTSGVYLYKLQAGNFSETKKMILTK
jgi:hypothetical protein